VGYLNAKVKEIDNFVTKKKKLIIYQSFALYRLNYTTKNVPPINITGCIEQASKKHITHEIMSWYLKIIK